MQFPTWTCACMNCKPCLARRSIEGLVSGSGQPNAPIESALISSTVINSRFSLSAARVDQAIRRTSSSTIKKENERFMGELRSKTRKDQRIERANEMAAEPSLMMISQRDVAGMRSTGSIVVFGQRSTLWKGADQNGKRPPDS